MRQIKWLIAHEPQHLFVRTASAFAERIKELTGGEVVIEPITAAEFKDQFMPEYDLTKISQPIFDALEQNLVQMSQTQVHYFSRFDINYRALDLPFLFRDHDHTTKVLEGEIGSALRERLANKSHMRGLAFTYSGGYRVIGSNDPINSVQELVGKRIRVNGNPINRDFMTAAGSDARSMNTYGYDEINTGDLDAAETTYIRFLGKHVLKTNHNMFLTCVVINNQLWNDLSDTEKAAFEQAAMETARLERQWSVDDADEFERNCVKNGVTIVDVPDEDRDYLRQLSESVYDKWEPQFMPGLVEYIKNVH